MQQYFDGVCMLASSPTTLELKHPIFMDTMVSEESLTIAQIPTYIQTPLCF